jgi:Ca2+-binding EF-hand superfamily protein
MAEGPAIYWLKSRHQKTANPRYLKTRDELDQEQEVKDVFTRIDYDCSGRIEMSEMHKVFVNNGIQMNKEEVEKFFALCKTEVQGKLNF